MKFFLFAVMFHCIIAGVHSQTATLTIELKNTPGKKIRVCNNNYAEPSVLLGERCSTVTLVNGKLIHQFNFSKPVFVRCYLSDGGDNTGFDHEFLISPGDDINVTADLGQPGNAVVITGKGSENNQPLVQKLTVDIDWTAYKKDSLPYKCMEVIRDAVVNNRKLLKEYTAKYTPTKDFKKQYDVFQKYFAVCKFLELKGNQKFSAGESFTRNKHLWDAVADSLLKKTPIDNYDLVDVPEYVYFLPMYVLRVKEDLWREAGNEEKKHEFYRQWYGTDIKKAEQQYRDDMENDLRERIINKYFTGKTNEYLYAALLHSTKDNKQDNVPVIFNRFKQKYPQSAYLSYLQPYIDEVLVKEARPLTSDMVLIEKTDSINSLNDVLALMKGKTVLVDMWGTWCSPCRKEIQENGEAIKAELKGKGVDYLYVANYDLANVERWKKLVPYYNLTGTHILASQELSKDIMAKVKGTGYPTYFIIKRDGTFELSKAGYPMKRKTLIKQIEDALK